MEFTAEKSKPPQQIRHYFDPEYKETSKKIGMSLIAGAVQTGFLTLDFGEHCVLISEELSADPGGRQSILSPQRRHEEDEERVKLQPT